MGHQKLHLVSQYAPVAQDEVLPQAGHVGGVEQRHVGLLGGAVAFTVVAGAAGGDHIHPVVHALLRKRNDVLACEVGFMETPAAVCADVAVADEELAVGQTGAQVKRIDLGHAPGADDAVDPDDRLQPRHCVMAAAKHRHLAAGLPAHLAGGVVHHRLLQGNPGLRQSLG